MRKKTIVAVMTATALSVVGASSASATGASTGGACVSNAGPSVTIGAWGVSDSPAQFQSMTVGTGPISECTGSQGVGN